MRPALSVLLTCLIGVSTASAQTPGRVSDHNANGWFMYFGDHPLGDRWGIHLEGQWRRHEVVKRWQQLLLRPGVNFRVNEHISVTGGYAFVETHPYGDFPARSRFPEHRLFQQVILRQPLAAKVSLQHRYRLEQRFLGVIAAGGTPPKVESWRFENRFRYLLRADLPFGPSGWYLGLYDEIFVNFGKNAAANLFDQNRAYGAVGKKLGEHFKLEVGYLNQIVAQRSGRVLEFNHTLQVGLISVLPFRKN
ncbi:MAG: DUF2490 domain-containing protein [Acidobacteriota bacterium]